MDFKKLGEDMLLDFRRQDFEKLKTLLSNREDCFVGYKGHSFISPSLEVVLASLEGSLWLQNPTLTLPMIQIKEEIIAYLQEAYEIDARESLAEPVCRFVQPN